VLTSQPADAVIRTFNISFGSPPRAIRLSACISCWLGLYRLGIQRPLPFSSASHLQARNISKCNDESEKVLYAITSTELLIGDTFRELENVTVIWGIIEL
jgi:hypothetical protein